MKKITIIKSGDIIPDDSLIIRIHVNMDFDELMYLIDEEISPLLNEPLKNE